MKWIKLTASASLLFSFLMFIGSCQRDDETDKESIYSKTGIVMSGAQNVPTSTSSATGSLDVSYDKGFKILNYKVTWNQLTGSPTGMSVYGLAPKGYAASPLTTPGGIVQVISVTGLTASGSLSGSLLVDGVYVKENDLLNGLYYIAIRTAAWPNGEIRGQVVFQ